MVGAAVSLLTALATAQPTHAADATTGPAWWSYDRPAIAAPVRSNIKLPMRDGTPLDCDLTLPGTPDGQVIPGRFPGLVVEFTPYVVFRGLYNSEAAYFASRGYAAMVCNIRGTGLSGGTWQGTNSAIENEDNYELVEWMAAQPWSNGRIGQTGFSYGGMTSYRVAALQPPHLVAIAPQESQADLYKDVLYPGGIYSTPGGIMNNWPATGAFLSGGRIDPAAEFARQLNHPLYHENWAQVSVAAKYDQIKVPVLGFGGWDDAFFRSGMVRNQQALADHSWAVFGPWTHGQVIGWPASAAPQLAGVCNTTETVKPGALLAWFDHWVAQIPGAPLPSARVTSFEGPVGTGTGWKEFDSWEPVKGKKNGRQGELALTSDGELQHAAGKPGRVTFSEPLEPTAPGGSVAFTTRPLTEDHVLAGAVDLHLEVTLDQADAHFHAELIDVAPDGREKVVNDGFLKASHREADEYLSPLTPGRRTDLDIEIRPDHWRFAAGHQVRVRISGGSASLLTPVTTPVTVTVHTGANGSYVRYPVPTKG